jgi:hypothetical protein
MLNRVSQNICKAVREIEFVKIWSWSEYIICKNIKIVKMYVELIEYTDQFVTI